MTFKSQNWSKINNNSWFFISILLQGTCGMFDWTLFDNSNRRKVVRRPKELGCSTRIMFDGKLTIVEHKINRNKSEKWLCSINSYFDFENWQLSNITLVELNQVSDYVWLMLCSTNVCSIMDKTCIYFVEHSKCKWLYYLRLGTCSWPNLS